MMHEHGKSDSAVGAVKPANKAERSAAELVEQRAGTKGNADQQSTRRAQERESVSQALGRIRQAAKQRKKEKFTTLFHHISVELLRLSFFAIKKDAAPGVDGLTWQDYEADLDRKIEDLHDRVQRGAYRALPSRRQYIPKPDGRQRPIAIAALEDKIVQRATAAVLSTIYEEEFLGFSYGFRPKRSQHDALDALVVGITSTKVNWILEVDVRSFFDEVSQSWLIEFQQQYSELCISRLDKRGNNKERRSKNCLKYPARRFGWKMRVDKSERVGIIDGGVTVGHFHMPPAFQRREHHKQIGHAIARVFVIVTHLASGLGRNWLARFGDHLLRGFVEAHDGALAIARSLIDLQHVFHVGDKGRAGVGCNDPLLLQMRLENVFLRVRAMVLSLARSTMRSSTTFSSSRRRLHLA